MSLNRWMHPRNVFRTKPDFRSLAAEFPEFEPFLKRFYNDNVTIDYKNPEALRTLSRILLAKYFSLDVHFPPSRLVPAVPQRLNYVLWIEDLVSLLDVRNEEVIRGIDVGCGASCIFPFLICRNNRSWQMTASEVDPESFRVAMQNVARNELSSRIVIKLNEENSSKFSSLFASGDDRSYHFLMCNPPFFKTRTESNISDTNISDTNISDSNISEFQEEDRRSTANESIEVESSFEGGEVAFVEEIISESVNVGVRVKIYSVMLGKKSSLVSLKRIVKSYKENGQISSFTSTEFCQGRTMRWGLSWTFIPDLDLNQVPKTRNKSGKKLSLVIEYKKGLDYSVEGIAKVVKKLLLDDLKVESLEQTRETKQSVEMVIRSNTNTWSHQRRKRRQKVSDSGNESSCSPGIQDLKRKRDDSDDDEPPTIFDNKRIKDIDICTTVKDETSFLLDATLVLRKEGKITMTLSPGDKCCDRESVHQLVQYFKNKI